MGYKTRIQRITRKKSQQWYVNFPSALAQALEFAKSEVVEWVVESKDKLVLRRHVANRPQRARRASGRAKK